MFGEDATVLVVSPYGVGSFQHQVNLNNALIASGQLALRGSHDDLDQEIEEIVTGDNSNIFLSFADWSASRAYAMGLGKVFVNLEGREPQGIVAPGDYDGVVEELRTMLLGLRDPDSHEALVTSVRRRDELFTGPFVEPGTWTWRWLDEAAEEPHHGFADLYVEFAPRYRVSWNTTMGGLDTKLVTINDKGWSGGTVSMSADALTGLLASSHPLAHDGGVALQDVPATLLALYGIDPAGAGLRGHPFATDKR